MSISITPTQVIAPPGSPITPTQVIAPPDSPITPTQVIAPPDSPITPTQVIAPPDSPITPTQVIAPPDSPITPTQVIAPPGSPITPTQVIAPPDSPITPTQVIAPSYKAKNKTFAKSKVEDNPYPIRHNEILTRFQELFPELDSTLAESILKTIYLKRRQLPFSCMERIKRSDLFPHEILVDQQYFQVITGNVGTGGNGAVTKGPVIPFETAPEIEASPSKKAKTLARKISHIQTALSFSPVQKITQEIRMKMNPTQKQGLTYYLATSHLPNGYSTALMPYHEGQNFVQTVFKNASDLITSFGLTARILAEIHAQGKVYRDFKGLNVMHTDSGPVIIDPDDIKDIYTVAAHTHGTPEYLNPSSFGSVEESLVNQKKKWGLQRPCDDMYAFAVTGISILRRHLQRIVPKDQCQIHTSINQLKPQYYTTQNPNLEYTNESLVTFGRKYGYRAFFWEKFQCPKTRTTIPERVGVYPSLENYQSLFHEIFSNASIPVDEAESLKNFAALCVTIKHQPDNNRYDGLIAQQKCTEALANKEQDTITTTTSRRRKRDEYEPRTLDFQNAILS